jgi:ornithine cyclodeaminase/alanine dehydrogenase-like protein (mu-crystallin family)
MGGDAYTALTRALARKAALSGSVSPTKRITTFDSTGIARQDVAAAAFLYDKAQQQGFGSI